MMPKTDHQNFVSAWLEREEMDPPGEDLLPLFSRGFDAMWRRAHVTLGDVTLTAIADRVLYTATERFPLLSKIKVEAAGLQLQALREQAVRLPPAQLTAGLRFILVEFLTVLGNLTAEILTPALHRELWSVSAEPADAAKPTAQDETSEPKPLDGEEPAP